MLIKAKDIYIDVRKGRKEDVPLLMSFIKDMAEFEKLEVHTTEKILTESLY